MRHNVPSLCFGLLLLALYSSLPSAVAAPARHSVTRLIAFQQSSVDTVCHVAGGEIFVPADPGPAPSIVLASCACGSASDDTRNQRAWGAAVSWSLVPLRHAQGSCCLSTTLCGHFVTSNRGTVDLTGKSSPFINTSNICEIKCVQAAAAAAGFDHQLNSLIYRQPSTTESIK